MPKKFKGENSKAAAAKERKSALKAEEDEKKQKALEDEYWRDDDKYGQRKQQRKDDKEKKRLDQLERKKEQDALLEEEMAAIKSAKTAAPSKVTRADIEDNLQKSTKASKGTRQSGQGDMSNDDGPPLEENLNRLEIDGEEARDVDQAISLLSEKESAVDMHPEKRMKAAFKAYEERTLPILKAENPNMRLSQLKQIIKKDWMKSPDNPLIQAQMAMRS